ncbi:alkylated DNA repair dioxygenase [Methylovirgula ligni]|uniref:DNA-N1-methyladenine dioxygenase n=1 Tax=Methylovirgula ligni TaxID=569860 RepID=A0A3D9YR53_9HYPH|nr:alpha-ketoglutarate-dependent dioxygenase AlkB [Methylovirgula ligni]QAY95010.1 alkylated DNA repair dioxygenase [Methylovirgula ligni]REF84528.1 DNA-N1-methyladenine dioxygenase [Methylovirgula ligni]
MTLFKGARETFADGLIYAPGYLDIREQDALLAAVEAAIEVAPLFQPRMPRTGTPFSVKMTNCGALGWVSDQERGYRYQAEHPETGRSWPAIPVLALRAWEELGDYPHAPEACLINVYGPEARMGLHQDRGEADLTAPVVSLSLGASCIFRWGPTRSGKTQSLELASGDALVLAGPARLAYHGVARILAATSALLDGDRINLTLRRVTKPKR